MAVPTLTSWPTLNIVILLKKIANLIQIISWFFISLLTNKVELLNLFAFDTYFFWIIYIVIPIFYWDDLLKTAFYIDSKSNLHCKSFYNWLLSFIYSIFNL